MLRLWSCTCRQEANGQTATDLPETEAAARFAQAAVALKRKDAQDRAAVQVRLWHDLLAFCAARRAYPRSHHVLSQACLLACVATSVILEDSMLMMADLGPQQAHEQVSARKQKCVVGILC